LILSRGRLKIRSYPELRELALQEPKARELMRRSMPELPELGVRRGSLRRDRLGRQ
jgi:hypothetical protein